MTGPVLGVDVGGSKVLAVVLDDDGCVRLTRKRATGRGTDPDRLVRLVVTLLDEARGAGYACTAVGLGFPGLVDHAHGLVRSSVMLDGWCEVALTEELHSVTGIPCVLDNDVNVAALAELDARGRPPPSCMLMVAVGTGIGGAICLDGELFRGVSGVSGEIGNTTIDPSAEFCWCGRRGCLNVLASGSVIEELTPRLGREGAVTHAARALGVGIANAVQLLNPDLVVLGGGVLEIGDSFLAQVRETLAHEVFPEALAACRVERTVLGHAAAAIGAGRLAAQAGAGLQSSPDRSGTPGLTRPSRSLPRLPPLLPGRFT
jgi:glucokinase